MLISLMFSVAVYHFATDTLTHTLTTQQARIYKAFPVFSSDPFFIRDKDAEQGAHAILQNLIYFNFLVFVGAGLASYWLAQRTLRPIEASNERQKRFVADASHELRTPLTAIQMSTEVALLDKGAHTADLRSALQSNLEETGKLTTLLNDLLRLSQLDSDEAQLSFAVMPLIEVVQQAVEKTKHQADLKDIKVDATAAHNHSVYGDKNSLVQLIVILLDNAIKYSPEHSTVTISSRLTVSNTTVTIADNGIGIDREALAHVFDRFYRADKARRGSEGYGLGLSIAKRIADLHGGTITITSRPGKGTTVAIGLPTSGERAA
jgi:signal transduction histidine kinase